VSEPRAFFKEVKKHPERFYIIHYSSQSLYDEGVDRDGLSPRITSIAVMHVSTRQTVTFAIHAVAEELGISKDQVEARYDEIEGAILERFYSFARDRREKYWIHWNMRNIVFGFEHLEHRYRVLTKKEPPLVPMEVRVNLNDMFREWYGSGYAPDPRMLNLMLLNGERDTRFLVGKEEAEAFKARDFIRMHTSTISKVEFFRYALMLSLKGRLKTAGRNFHARIDRLLDSRWTRFAGLVSMTIALGTAIVGAAMWVVHKYF
jgi:hypothetical protein